jgi:sugar phosphate isomerase/epimerase
MLNKYSISQLALPEKVTEEVIDLLKLRGITGIELLPARLTNNWSEWSSEKLYDFSDLLKRKKIVTPAFQGIFYKTNISNIFFKNEQKLIINHIQKICKLAKIFDVNIMIIGAPYLRLLSKSSKKNDIEYSIILFKILSSICENNGIKLCIEAIGGDSNQNFISNHIELCEYIKLVDSHGMGLHVDSSILIEKNEAVEEIIKYGIEISHFHISENKLQPYLCSSKSQLRIIKKLKENKVKCWFSFEYMAESKEQSFTLPDHFIAEVINT